MNKFSLFSRVMTISILSISVVACGGGGDVAGDTEEFFTNPDEWKVASLGCGGGAQVVVTIVGGTPPYRVHNPFPRGLQLDRTEVSGKDPKFLITTLGGCMETVPVLVLDYHSRTTEIEITVEEPEEAAQ